MRVTTLQVVIVFCLLCVITPVASGCDTGWFGNSCQYQCHCSSNYCDDSGECTDGSKCDSEWFGPACQYQDLFSFAVTSTVPTIDQHTLKDRDDNTCLNGNMENITINLNSSYTITWIRVTVKNTGFKRNITMMLNDAQGSTYTCNKAYLIDDTTMDLVCDAQILTTQLTLTGQDVGYLCSLSISGGRNVALKQRAVQSSEYSDKNIANKAVDGNRNTDFTKDSCTHTAVLDAQPNWNVQFLTNKLVNRYVLFNRANNMPRLRQANISSYNADNKLVFNYILPDADQIVFVLTDVTTNVHNVTIYAGYTNSLILTLCEVEIYGDSVCSTDHFGLECDKSCNCEKKTETCFVATGGCPSGCAAGFYGESCQKNCSPGKWGVDCINQCSHCKNKTCDRFQGTCNLGCEDGYKGETCNDECSSFTWGKDCSNKCSPQCFNKSCNITNGVCLSGCIDGYTGDTCADECPNLTWGSKCFNNCSRHCANKTCDKSDGTCDNGCEAGYSGHTCDQTCPKLTWGVRCLKRCSDHCVNKTCDFVNGICDYGCDGVYNNTQCLDEFRNDESSSSTAAIVAPIVVAIVLIVVAIAGVILWRRRRDGKKKVTRELVPKELKPIKQNKLNTAGDNNASNQKGKLHKHALRYWQKHFFFVDGQKAHFSPVTSNLENTYSNTALPMVKDTSIAVNDLNEFMRLHKLDFFTEQFKNIPTPVNVSMEIGLHNENKHKNRYKNICTYDHSRVHLMINTAKHEGDYINASYIEGFMDKEKFIASQGPNKVIINDFVRLLWEQKVDKVVMLTNLIEEGQVKCERYWPEEGKAVFGSIKVRLASTQVFADYTIRQLELRKKDEPIHQMTHFHFTSWPDKGVPLTPWSLVDFEQRVASDPTTRPVVVHCSAGVGRTGTFIALCNVMKEAEDTGRIDFFKTVVKLRQDRVMMIQTPAQYEFLHRAAQVAIVCIGTTVTSRDITDRIRILGEEVFKGRTKMETEFQAVCSVSGDFTKHIKDVENTEQEASVYENNVNNTAIVKNRFLDILPEKAYSALLIPDDSHSGDYINAVVVPSLKKKDQQVLTQLPLATTVVDFWRLVMDYKVSLIVEFEFNLQSTDPSIADYLPSKSGESLTFGTNELRIISSKKSTLWEELQLSIRTTKKSTHVTSVSLTNITLKVSLLKCFSTELDVKNLLLLLKHIRSCKSPGEERVLYMCRDGAKYSGLACVLTLLLDRMDNDLRLTVPLVVGAIKSIRPQVIPTLDQYRILYQVLHRYTESTSSYTNFGDYQQ
ncbi:unnamed protein product, partial [Lymnaea stagnalis]